MSDVFLKMLNMSFTASIAVIAVILLRLIIRKAPKRISCLLWLIVALRLICPVSVESIFSLIPSAEPLPNTVITQNSFDIDTGINFIDTPVNDYLGDHYYEGVTVQADNGLKTMSLLTVIWLIGVAAMAAYAAVSYARVRKSVSEAVCIRDNIYAADKAQTPFILGIIKPKIYLPSNLCEEYTDYVIAHERAHIKRCDHIIKPIGFALMSVYWFNPFIWLAYALLCRDIEAACDQRVLMQSGEQIKKLYSEALIGCAAQQRSISACPLAFGEVNVKSRIKGVLSYKRPVVWISAAAAAAVVIAVICLLTNPIGNTLQKLANIDSSAEFSLFKYESNSYEAISVYDENLADKLMRLRISKTEISQSRAEDRDMTNTLVLKSDSSAYGLHICFNEDFTEVWVNDGVKPSLSHSVVNPKKAAQIYHSLCSYVGADTNKTGVEDSQEVINAVLLENIKEKYPMYFNLQTAKGLGVYIWEIAPDSYRCGLVSGRNLGYTQAELSELFSKGTSIEEMRLIVASYYPENAKQSVVINPYIHPASSYTYTVNDAFRSKLNSLFWADFPTLNGTEYNHFTIVDRTQNEQLGVGMAFEEFYSDSKYSYSFSCVKSQYVEVRYNDGTVENIKDALKSKHIVIGDLDRFGISYNVSIAVSTAD